jgi:hypothetical protein
MYTKLEALREANGESASRVVFDMPSEREAIHYRKSLFREQLKYADEIVERVIQFLETQCAKGFGKNAKACWEDRGRLCDLMEIYQVAEPFREYAIDCVMVYFDARMELARAALKGE